MESLICAATRDRDPGIRYFATQAILKRGSRTLALSMAYDSSDDVAGWALGSLYAYHREDNAFVQQVYEAYLGQNVDKKGVAVGQVKVSLRLLKSGKP